jgi:hypothetical protein
MPTTMANKFAVTHIQENKKQSKFVITLDETTKEAIVVNTFKDMVSVNVANATKTNFAVSGGLMGNYMDGSLLGRDGVTIIEDHNLFGKEWQVLDSEVQLFQSTSSHQKLASCDPPTNIKGRRRLGETIAMEAAEKACAHFGGNKKDMCVFDVMAMDDLEVAHAHGAF